MRKANPNWWWLTQIFWVYIVSLPMFVGLSLPFGAIYHGKNSSTGFGLLDIIAIGSAASGLVIGYFADTQLQEFMQANVTSTKGKAQILYTGLWRYSQHPNYFGETLWWWSVGVLGVICGEWWVFLTAPLFNSYVMWESIKFIEERMRSNPLKRDGFDEYQKCVSWLIPVDTVGLFGGAELDPKWWTQQEVQPQVPAKKRGRMVGYAPWVGLLCIKKEY